MNSIIIIDNYLLGNCGNLLYIMGTPIMGLLPEHPLKNVDTSIALDPFKGRRFTDFVEKYNCLLKITFSFICDSGLYPVPAATRLTPAARVGS